MTTLARIVYISRSTFDTSSRSDSIDPGLARILAKSRKNNREANIVGGLLFGDGCFLQCLEGEQSAVEPLYRKIAADPRHKDVRLLIQVPINQLAFSAWSMKYVPMEQPLRAVLAAHGLRRFDPYNFTHAQVDAVLECLLAQHDPSQHYATSLLDPAGGGSAAMRGERRGTGADKTDAAARRRANWALAVACVALLVSSATALAVAAHLGSRTLF